MIGIYGPDTERIAQMYYKRLRKWLRVSEEKDKFRKLMAKPNIEQDYKNMLEFTYSLIEPEQNNRILAKPDTLKDIADDFKRDFNDFIEQYDNLPDEDENKKNTAFGKFKKNMEDFYDGFMKSSRQKETFGMQLSRSLNIRTCPYCNRSYTFSIDEKMDEASDKRVRVRPEFDHFYPKAKYPCLALCFYNLIPSCPVCNHLKREREIDLNPYLIDTENSPICFNLKNEKGVKTAEDIVLQVESSDGRGSDNIEVMGLKHLYNEHKDYVKEIMDKAVAYNKSYYDGLMESFRGMDLNAQDIENRIWGTYTECSDFGKRPLSKLTRDILKIYNIR